MRQSGANLPGQPSTTTLPTSCLDASPSTTSFPSCCHCLPSFPAHPSLPNPQSAPTQPTPPTPRGWTCLLVAHVLALRPVLGFEVRGDHQQVAPNHQVMKQDLQVALRLLPARAIVLEGTACGRPGGRAPPCARDCGCEVTCGRAMGPTVGLVCVARARRSCAACQASITALTRAQLQISALLPPHWPVARPGAHPPQRLHCR